MSDFKVNPDHLDVEWLKQPALYQYYSKLLARADYALSILKSKLEDKIRQNPPVYWKRATDKAVETAIEGNKEYAKKKLLVKYLAGEVKSLEHKKKALEKLTELYLSGYWAKPRISTTAQEEYANEAQAQIHEMLKEEPRLKQYIDNIKKGGKKDAV